MVSAWCRLLRKSDVWPVDLLTFSKRTPQGQFQGPPTYTHQVWWRASKDLGGVGEQTDRQTDKRCSIYSMMFSNFNCKIPTLQHLYQSTGTETFLYPGHFFLSRNSTINFGGWNVIKIFFHHFLTIQIPGPHLNQTPRDTLFMKFSGTLFLDLDTISCGSMWSSG